MGHHGGLVDLLPIGLDDQYAFKKTQNPGYIVLNGQYFFLTVLFLILGLLEAHGIIDTVFPRLIVPLIFLLVIPVISRNSIPWVRSIEQVGKRSYGLYLMHLIVLDLLLAIIAFLVPGLVRFTIPTFLLLFAAGVLLPLWIMDQFTKSPARKYFRYIFG